MNKPIKILKVDSDSDEDCWVDVNESLRESNLWKNSSVDGLDVPIYAIRAQ